MKIAKKFIDQGQLVPADLVAQMIIKKVFSPEAAAVRRDKHRSGPPDNRSHLR